MTLKIKHTEVNYRFLKSFHQSIHEKRSITILYNLSQKFWHTLKYNKIERKNIWNNFAVNIQTVIERKQYMHKSFISIIYFKNLCLYIFLFN